MQDKISLDDLRLVHAIGAGGSLSGAAGRLGVDHSTAFRRLGAVEARLGVRLFQRARDGYAPTPAGEAAIEAAGRILEDVGALEQRLAGEDLRPSGDVRVTTTDTLAGLLAPCLAKLRRVHPEITVELVVANAFFTLTKRDADIALRPAARAPEHLVGRRLADIATALYAAPGYPAGDGAGAAVTDLDWIGFDESLGHLASARWVAARIPIDRIVLRATTLPAIQEAARAGMGVAALPCFLGDADPALRRLHPPIPEMDSALWLLTHRDLRRVARIRTVLDAIARHVARQRGLLEGREGRS